MTQSKVICIGEALIDQIVSKSDKKFTNYLGGAPANVACALRKLDIPTSIICCLGDDDFGREFINLFQQLNLNIDFLQVDEKCSTRIVKVIRDNKGDRSFSGFVNKNNAFFADEMLDKLKIENNIAKLKNLFLESKYFITGTNLLTAEKSSEALLFLCNYAQNFNLKIVIDVNWRNIFWDNSKIMSKFNRSRHIQKIKNFLNCADILKLAYEEANLFFNNHDPSEISQSLKNKPDVIITNGEKPISWFINGIKGVTKLKVSMKIIDTTGAGDSFLAGLISQFVNDCSQENEESIHKSVLFASVCGLLTCLGEGAIEHQPEYIKVQGFLEDLGL